MENYKKSIEINKKQHDSPIVNKENISYLQNFYQWVLIRFLPIQNIFNFNALNQSVFIMQITKSLAKVINAYTPIGFNRVFTNYENFQF